MPKRTAVVAATMVLIALGAPASAQVINGESVYEDNFEHTPPADPPKEERRGQAASSDAAHSAAARRDRDRD